MVMPYAVGMWYVVFGILLEAISQLMLSTICHGGVVCNVLLEVISLAADAVIAD